MPSSMLERVKEALVNRAADLITNLGVQLSTVDYMEMRKDTAKLDEVLKALQAIQEEESK